MPLPYLACCPCVCFEPLTSPPHDIIFSYSHLCTCLFDCMSLMYCIYVPVTIGSHAISYACLNCHLALVCLCRSDNRVRVVYAAIAVAFLLHQPTSPPLLQIYFLHLPVFSPRLLTNPPPLHSINLRVPCYHVQMVGTINASMVSRCNSGTNDADGATSTKLPQ